MLFKLTGFSPDSDPATPGVILDCDNLIPSVTGMQAHASAVDAGLAPLDGPCSGAAIAVQLDGSRRVIAGTKNKLWDIAGNIWTDRSKAGGYTGLNRWRFAVFGDNVIATNRDQPIQQAKPGANFADIPTAPVAGIVCSAAGFVLAFDVSDQVGSFGDHPDGWWCSSLYNQELWTPSVATQSANGRLVTSPGRIKAAREFGDDVVAYKDNSMYLGRAVGPPLVWEWQRIPGNIGTSGQESVVVVNSTHFFIGPTDIYIYDGTTPRSIGSPLRNWLFQNLNPAFRQNIIGATDLAKELVYWYFPSKSSSGQCDSCIVYNIRTQEWGKLTQSIEAALEYAGAQITWDGLGTIAATWDDLPTIAYDSPFWINDKTQPAIIGTDHKLYTLTGPPGRSWLRTGDIGNETGWSLLRRVTPRYRDHPVDASGTNFYRPELGMDPVKDQSISQSTKERFDFLRSARWHSIRMDWNSAVSLNGYDVDIKPISQE